MKPFHVLFCLILLSVSLRKVECYASGCTLIQCKDGGLDCYDDPCARKYLSDNHVRVTSTGRCTDPNNRYCTSLKQIHRDVIDGANSIVAFKQSSSCKVTVVGGTETGHSWEATGVDTHWNGWRLDIGREGIHCVRNYIQNNYRAIGAKKYCGMGDTSFEDKENYIDINFSAMNRC